jgi:hypothetical protein
MTVALLATTLALICPAPAGATPRASATLRIGGTPHAGCQGWRRAVAHHAGGVTLEPQPFTRPMPCAVFLGGSSESALVGATSDGAVFYASVLGNSLPAPWDTLVGPESVTRSLDGGARWTTLPSGGPATGGLVPPWMDVDPQTNRVWFVTPLGDLCGARISWSDDDGQRWTTNPSVGCPGMGSDRVLEGPAPRGGAQPVGYPHVVYYCANLIDILPSLLFCSRSLDGGRTFAPIAGFPDLADLPDLPGGCGVDHIAAPGTVGADGYLYFPLNECGSLGVAVSRDEGTTWQSVPVARATHLEDIYISSTAGDAAGNVYIAWIAGSGNNNTGVGGAGLPYVSVSRDHGLSWSAPMMVGAPGVTAARHPAITAEGDGRVAVAYIGSIDGGATFSGYLTLTADALARQPIFWSAPVNDPSEPLLSGTRTETFGDRLWVLSDAFGRDGWPWAGFQCTDESACPNERLGVVGSLAPPATPVP